MLCIWTSWPSEGSATYVPTLHICCLRSSHSLRAWRSGLNGILSSIWPSGTWAWIFFHPRSDPPSQCCVALLTYISTKFGWRGSVPPPPVWCRYRGNPPSQQHFSLAYKCFIVFALSSLTVCSLIPAVEVDVWVASVRLKVLQMSTITEWCGLHPRDISVQHWPTHWHYTALWLTFAIDCINGYLWSFSRNQETTTSGPGLQDWKASCYRFGSLC